MLGQLAVLTLYRQVEAVRIAARQGRLDDALTDLLAVVDSLADDRGGHTRRRGHEQRRQLGIESAG